ncbi:MAG: cell wall metabolism sensor histidine kinase WalK, partial [Clostridiales bacterium]|nr:cell wall metabolism sensor histidine kinase WalK [Clostridiales bacterium]
MKSIRWRLVIMYITLVFIVMIASGTFIIISFRNQAFKTAERELRDDAESIRKEVIDLYPKDQFPAGFAGIGIGVPSPESGREWHILDGVTGRTILTTDIVDPLQYRQFESADIIAALAGEENGSFTAGKRDSKFNGQSKTYMDLALPVTKADGSKYIIFVRMDAERAYASINQTTAIIAVSIPLAMALAGVLGILFTSTLTEPIRNLTAKAMELARGNLKQEFSVVSQDEIGQLTQSFNDMARDLSRTIEGMENEKNKVEIILYSMTDGVLAFDNNGALIHANQVSQELLNLKSVESLTINDIMKILVPETEQYDFDAVDTFKEYTIAIGDKFINALINPYRNKDGNIGGIVIVFQDITKHKKLDNMRKEFVANVSHEIRTPLTNIKSYTETLIDGAIAQEDVAMEFLEIINGEADRMTLIVKDLLELSSIDNNQIVLNLQKMDLCGLVRQTVKKHKLSAEKQNKTLVFDDPATPMTVLIDSSRISQVLGNIIS